MKNIVEIELDGLTIDTGYGEHDCMLVSTVDLIKLEIISTTIWLIDRDGEDHEYSSNCDKFNNLILDAARDYDLSPYCGHCNASTKVYCKCGPTTEND